MLPCIETVIGAVFGAVMTVIVVVIVYEASKNDPYARPGQKKQGRESKEKKKESDDWKGNPNKKPPLPKQHTPGKDHRKY